MCSRVPVVVLVAASCWVSGCTDPTTAEARRYYKRGLAHSNVGECDLALRAFDEAIQLNPDDGDWYRSRSFAKYRLGNYAGSVADLDEAVLREPDNAAALNGRAWLLATCPDESVRDGDKAVSDATKACQLTKWKSPEWIDTLAAANAEAGDFAKAIEWLNKAIETAPEDQKAGYRSRIALYRAGKPLRQD